jgi:hypothetical protein
LHCNAVPSDIICAPQNARWVATKIPNAVLYESKQGWNHDFMLIELDKLLRMLLQDGADRKAAHFRFAFVCVCPEPVLASRRLSYELTPRYLKKAP